MPNLPDSGHKAVIGNITGSGPKLLNCLNDINLTPGVKIEVLYTPEHDSIFTLKIGADIEIVAGLSA